MYAQQHQSMYPPPPPNAGAANQYVRFDFPFFDTNSFVPSLTDAQEHFNQLWRRLALFYSLIRSKYVYVNNHKAMKTGNMYSVPSRGNMYTTIGDWNDVCLMETCARNARVILNKCAIAANSDATLKKYEQMFAFLAQGLSFLRMNDAHAVDAPEREARASTSHSLMSRRDYMFEFHARQRGAVLADLVPDYHAAASLFRASITRILVHANCCFCVESERESAFLSSFVEASIGLERASVSEHARDDLTLKRAVCRSMTIMTAICSIAVGRDHCARTLYFAIDAMKTFERNANECFANTEMHAQLRADISDVYASVQRRYRLSYVEVAEHVLAKCGALDQWNKKHVVDAMARALQKIVQDASYCRREALPAIAHVRGAHVYNEFMSVMYANNLLVCKNLSTENTVAANALSSSSSSSSQPAASVPFDPRTRKRPRPTTTTTTTTASTVIATESVTAKRERQQKQPQPPPTPDKDMSQYVRFVDWVDSLASSFVERAVQPLDVIMRKSIIKNAQSHVKRALCASMKSAYDVRFPAAKINAREFSDGEPPLVALKYNPRGFATNRNYVYMRKAVERELLNVIAEHCKDPDIRRHLQRDAMSALNSTCRECGVNPKTLRNVVLVAPEPSESNSGRLKATDEPMEVVQIDDETQGAASAVVDDDDGDTRSTFSDGGGNSSAIVSTSEPVVGTLQDIDLEASTSLPFTPNVANMVEDANADIDPSARPPAKRQRQRRFVSDDDDDSEDGESLPGERNGIPTYSDAERSCSRNLRCTVQHLPLLSFSRLRLANGAAISMDEYVQLSRKIGNRVLSDIRDALKWDMQLYRDVIGYCFAHRAQQQRFGTVAAGSSASSSDAQKQEDRLTRMMTQEEENEVVQHMYKRHGILLIRSQEYICIRQRYFVPIFARVAPQEFESKVHESERDPLSILKQLSSHRSGGQSGRELQLKGDFYWWIDASRPDAYSLNLSSMFRRCEHNGEERRKLRTLIAGNKCNASTADDGATMSHTASTGLGFPVVRDCGITNPVNCKRWTMLQCKGVDSAHAKMLHREPIPICADHFVQCMRCAKYGCRQFCFSKASKYSEAICDEHQI